MASAHVQELVAKVERMTIDQLLTGAVLMVQNKRLDLAEVFVQRAADLLALQRMCGK